jgi:hypothetical protein
MKTYNDINTLIRIVENTGRTLGFSEIKDGMETLYSVDINGNVWTTGKIERTDEFNARGREWFPTDNIGNDAEFVGYYKQVVNFI